MKALFLTGALLFSISANSLTIDGIEIKEVIPATAKAPELQLKGASVRRAYAIVDTYIGQLYVEDPALDAQQLIDQDKARRMVFHVVSNRVSARRFTNAINEGLSINISQQQMAGIKPRVEKLVKLFDHKFVQGTIGYIQWYPKEQLSRIVIDGVVKGSVAGKDLNDAMLKIWIGEHPVSERFRREVLGQPDPYADDEDDEDDF